MKQNQVITLFTAATSIALLLIVGIYLLLNSTTTQMMDMTSTTTDNSAIALILISAAIIISIALVLYFSFSRKKKSPIPEKDEGDISCPAKTQPIEEKSAPTEVRPFDVFLCYKKSSGKDFADHLKVGLEEVGFHTFQDCKDIPRTVDTQEGWANFRDKALEQSKYFVLIMTPGFNLSSEVVKEIGLARKQPSKKFIFFRLRGMKRNITIDLGTEILDIGKLEQVSFESKEELLRLALNILS